MTLELIRQLEGVADLGVELDGRIPRNCERLAISRERVVGNRVVEEMVDLRGCHFVDLCLLAIGGALYYRLPGSKVVVKVMEGSCSADVVEELMVGSGAPRFSISTPWGDFRPWPPDAGLQFLAGERIHQTSLHATPGDPRRHLFTAPTLFIRPIDDNNVRT